MTTMSRLADDEDEDSTSYERMRRTFEFSDVLNSFQNPRADVPREGSLHLRQGFGFRRPIHRLSAGVQRPCEYEEHGEAREQHPGVLPFRGADRPASSGQP